MRALWLALLAGALAGAGIAWWQSRDASRQAMEKQQRAQSAAAAQARDAEPALYRWRDATGVLHIADRPPEDRPYQRIPREAKTGIEVRGD